ncbi:hypothetical protein [Chelativorans intermedius]|uniref:Secreted protein n=1 Tax=Chelativorans intermedius TaxID=515947 RepID=A0ABV6D9Y3_9HYPH|nr:hypothetical protein [Chelativorans intermedius]MCT8997868.1 hypothetical protein [Chelativorans intermedius]
MSAFRFRLPRISGNMWKGWPRASLSLFVLAIRLAAAAFPPAARPVDRFIETLIRSIYLFLPHLCDAR